MEVNAGADCQRKQFGMHVTSVYRIELLLNVLSCQIVTDAYFSDMTWTAHLPHQPTAHVRRVEVLEVGAVNTMSRRPLKDQLPLTGYGDVNRLTPPQPLRSARAARRGQNSIVIREPCQAERSIPLSDKCRCHRRIVVLGPLAESSGSTDARRYVGPSEITLSA